MPAGGPDVLLEELARGAIPGAAAARRRMLLIVNPYAATVSDRLRHLVAYALQGRYEVTAIDTEASGHATELCREAAREGYEVVVAFGGDGTANEAVNGLRGCGADVALSCLPGGSANVFCKMLGIPGEIVDATEHLLRLADEWRPRRVDLGEVVYGDARRLFTFNAGVGLDADVVRAVDERPRLKARYGPWWFMTAAFALWARRYAVDAPRVVLRAGGQALEGVTAVVQNGDPYTYFNNRPIRVAEAASLDGGTLSAAVMRRAAPLDMPSMVWRLVVARPPFLRHRQVGGVEGVHELELASADGRPAPLQVDGDYVGDVERAGFVVRPRALTVVG